MTTRFLNDPRSERGVSMVFTLLSLSMVTLVGLTLASVGLSTLNMATAEAETSETLAIADAGIEHAKQLVLYQEWESLNVFLGRGDGLGCTFDELAGVPTGPLPGPYPAAGTAGNWIPATGRTFGAGRYYVQLCDNHITEQVLVTPGPDADPNIDVDKVVRVRSVGFGPGGSRAAIESTFGAAAMPAVVVNGNLEVKGNPTVTGPAGSIHANGTLLLSGNPCTYVYYASVAGTTQTGNVQGGSDCTAAGVDSRPFSPKLNIPSLTPLAVARRAVASGVVVTTLLPKGWTDPVNSPGINCVSNDGCAYYGLPGSTGVASTLVAYPPTAPGPIPAGWTYANNGKTWSSKGETQAGTYYVVGNADIQANTGGVGGGTASLSVLAEGSISANGNPDVVPHATIYLMGPILMIAGHDLDLGATFDAAYEGLFYARHQLDIKGSPTLNGQVIALNEADTDYESKNPVTRTNGVMTIGGSPRINYSGNGLTSVRALTWRECRGAWTGTVVNAGVMTVPGTPCGAP